MQRQFHLPGKLQDSSASPPAWNDGTDGVAGTYLPEGDLEDRFSALRLSHFPAAHKHPRRATELGTHVMDALLILLSIHAISVKNKYVFADHSSLKRAVKFWPSSAENKQ